MSTVNKPTLSTRLAIALFGVARALLPKSFSEAYAAAIEETFVDGLNDERGIRRARFVARSVFGLLRVGVMELVSPTTKRRARARSASTSSPDGESLMSQAFQDLRYAIRTLAHQPSFTIVAVLTIALGIGANTTIFSVVDGVLLKPLPYPNANRLVVTGSVDFYNPADLGNMSIGDMGDVNDLPAIDTLVGFRSATTAITGESQPRLAKATNVSAGLLGIFGTHPLVGRDLSADDAGPDSPFLAVISHKLWQDHLGGAVGTVGSSIELGEIPYEIIGVAPPGFDFPEGTDVWRPERISVEGCDARGCRLRSTVGMLAGGVDLTTAQTQAATLAERLALEFPDTNHEIGFGVKLLQDVLVGEVKAGLWVLTGGVGLLLLIACCNVAILLLVRANVRKGEIATRAALGASRGRLIRQILLENLVLAIVGAAIGVAASFVAIGAFRGFAADTIPRIESVVLDGRVLGFSLLLTVVVAALVGLAPVVSLSREGMIVGLRSSGRGRDTPEGASRSRNILLTLEVAMSVLLLTGSGLLLKTFTQMFAVDLGYNTERIVRFSLAVPDTRYGDLDQVTAFYRSLEERIGGLPGVEATGSVFGAPLGPNHYSGWVRVESRGDPDPGEETFASVKTMTPGYFDTMGIPLLRGRSIEHSDVSGYLPVAVVNEAFVEENFPNEDPVGKEIYVAIGYGYADPGWTVVGVVKDVRSRSLVAEASPEVYVAQAQYGLSYMTVNVRTSPGAPSPINAIRSEVLALDPNVPMRSIETVRDAVNREVAPTRLFLILVVGFAGLAVFLTAVGLYGVVAYLVSRRTREIGIRVALGAQGSRIVRLVSVHGLFPAVAGLLLGLVTSIASARVLTSLLFEVAPHDASVLLGASVLVIIVSFVAALVPARRALGIDPVNVMRND